MRKFFGIDVPVAEAGVIVSALAKPTIVHYEAIHADGSGLLRKGDLAGLIDVEFRGFPGVVNHGTRLGVRCVRKILREFEVIEYPRRAPEPVVGIPAVKYRRVEML